MSQTHFRHGPCICLCHCLYLSLSLSLTAPPPLAPSVVLFLRLHYHPALIDGCTDSSRAQCWLTCCCGCVYLCVCMCVCLCVSVYVCVCLCVVVASCQGTAIQRRSSVSPDALITHLYVESGGVVSGIAVPEDKSGGHVVIADVRCHHPRVESCSRSSRPCTS